MRVLFSVLIALATLVPGVVLGFQIGGWAAPKLCPAPDGPNLCALLGTIVMMGVVPLLLSLVVAAVVWRAMAPSPDAERQLR